jgi:hypothetical protein
LKSQLVIAVDEDSLLSMKAFALAVVLVVGAWPSHSFACLMPPPALMDWAKCAVAKVSSQGRTDIDKWFTALNVYPEPDNLAPLRRNAQRWMPGLSRLCGSYSLLRRLEWHQMQRYQGYVDPLELTEDELHLIAVYLSVRKLRGGDDMKTCGG